MLLLVAKQGCATYGPRMAPHLFKKQSSQLAVTIKDLQTNLISREQLLLSRLSSVFPSKERVVLAQLHAVSQ